MAAVHPPDYSRPPPPLSIEGGLLVVSFEDYAFREPRTGFFVGDSGASYGERNPVREFSLNDDVDGFPPQAYPWVTSFDILPTEVVAQIVARLDIGSLLVFRGISAWCRGVVDSLQDFKQIMAFPLLLGAVTVLRCQSFDLKTLASRIRNLACVSCSHFGDMFYLITAERWCYPCWRREGGWGRQLTPTLLQPRYGLQPQLQTDIPHLVLSPGRYGWEACGQLGAPLLAFDTKSLHSNRKWYDHEDHIRTLPQHIDGHPHPISYAAVLRAPYFDEFTQSFEEGFCCRACAHEGREHSKYVGSSPMRGDLTPMWGVPYRRYTKDGIREHLEIFGKIYRINRDGQWRYAHEHPYTKWNRGLDIANELVRSDDLLQACRDKKCTFPQLQPIPSSW